MNLAVSRDCEYSHKGGVSMEHIESNGWFTLSKEKKEKAGNVISEMSAVAVEWNEGEKQKIFQAYDEWIQTAKDGYKLKPHQLLVLSKMLQETAYAELIEWLPDDFEKWEDKEELMARFFFGEKGLEKYREDVKKRLYDA